MEPRDRNEDKAGRQYWNRTERNLGVRMRPFAPRAGIRWHAKRMWHDAFVQTFEAVRQPHARLLELGCGGSTLLPYFARQFGFEVSGIDYSERGCQLATQMCSENGVAARVYCADFRDPPEELLGAFDAVVSFGVVEHFTDTRRTLETFSRFLRPGGTIVTVVPNMSGLVGVAQKLLSKQTYDTHESIGLERMRDAHEHAGLVVMENRYFMFVNLGVVSIGTSASLLKRALRGALLATTGVVWIAESLFGLFPPNRISSPYLWCTARLPGAAIEIDVQMDVRRHLTGA